MSKLNAKKSESWNEGYRKGWFDNKEGRIRAHLVVDGVNESDDWHLGYQQGYSDYSTETHQLVSWMAQMNEVLQKSAVGDDYTVKSEFRISNGKVVGLEVDVRFDGAPPPAKYKLPQDIGTWELTIRTLNSLKKMNIDTLDKLLATTPEELRASKLFGAQTMKELRNYLQSYGYRLGQNAKAE